MNSKEQLDLLYHPNDITGPTGNTSWQLITLTESASGNDDTYVLPLIPQNESTMIPFVNGVQNRSFEYIEETNSIRFTDGNVRSKYVVTLFVLERI